MARGRKHDPGRGSALPDAGTARAVPPEAEPAVRAARTPGPSPPVLPHTGPEEHPVEPAPDNHSALPRPRERTAPARIQILSPAPVVDCGRFAAKRIVGDTVEVSADVFRDGHEVLRAVVRYRGPGDGPWREAPMAWIDADVDGDRWAGSFVADEMGRWQFTLEAWSDLFATWREELRRKLAAGQQDLSGELSEGVVLLEEARDRAAARERRLIEEALRALRGPAGEHDRRLEVALDPDLLAAVERRSDRPDATRMDPPLELDVDRERARFGAWYELFPRSWGGFAGVRRELARFAELGFDVLYLPPIHPIGQTHRKGRDGALVAKPGDPGSPWAIGSAAGGHEAIDPELGSLEEFQRLVREARALGLEIALDFAIQCSVDHPWVREHPEWFNRRPDGTIKYAENPPKRYQDICNLNFDAKDWRGLWEALRDVVLLWVERGVRVFRVDNPHTKPLPFWEWLLGEVRSRHPDVLFLAEAFTRRVKLRAVAKVGFSQSYTYFTWKNSRWELTEYIDELAYSGMQEYCRPNFFVNTPDILNAYLAHGGPPAFVTRLVLAATLSPSYGIYSGFEHFENVPVRDGSEEYLHSEKYERRERRLDGPLLPLVARINRIRRENPALQELSNVAFLETENDALIAYLKQAGPNILITVASIDPRVPQAGLVVVPDWLELPASFAVEDLLDGARYNWHTGPNYVRLGPDENMAHVLRLEA